MPTRNRPITPSSQSQSSTIRPIQARRSSNAASTSSHLPSINLPSNVIPSRPSISIQSKISSKEINQSQPGSRPSLEVSHGSAFAPSPLSVYAPSTPQLRPVSPAPSNNSRKQSSRGGTPAAPDGAQSRRDHNTRVSFFDPANQASLDRLISGDSDVQDDGEIEEESAQATMANVEEMLEGYEWASEDVTGRKAARGAADLIEARLLDELMALEKVVTVLYQSHNLTHPFITYPAGKYSLIPRI